MNREQFAAYADVVVRVGTNLQPGQTLTVHSPVDAVELARALMDAAWRAGAGNVEVVYVDDFERYLLAKYAPDELLDRSSVVQLASARASREQRGASVTIFGDVTPAYFREVDESRLARTRPREVRELINRVLNEQLEAWTVIGFPQQSWAERMFGTPDVERLWAEIAKTCRLDRPDPVAAWNEHLDRLEQRTRLLDERRFDRLHFRGPGTDFEVGLLEGSRWIGGRTDTAWGQPFCANLPTEEVFTTPDRARAEGTLRATRPVAYTEGILVEGIELRFRGGRVVEARAASGEDFLRNHLRTDEGSDRLGEVALVADSPIGASGLLWYHTLFDENATSHVAYGAAYTSPVEGVEDLDEAAQEARGINQSHVHVDFAVGSPEVEVDGIDARGERVPILAGDDWLLS
ncbi:MAG: aminopeptidase [Gaiellaceae bacterium]